MAGTSGNPAVRRKALETKLTPGALHWYCPGASVTEVRGAPPVAAGSAAGVGDSWAGALGTPCLGSRAVGRCRCGGSTRRRGSLRKGCGHGERQAPGARGVGTGSAEASPPPSPHAAVPLPLIASCWPSFASLRSLEALLGGTAAVLVVGRRSRMLRARKDVPPGLSGTTCATGLGWGRSGNVMGVSMAGGIGRGPSPCPTLPSSSAGSKRASHRHSLAPWRPPAAPCAGKAAAPSCRLRGSRCGGKPGGSRLCMLGSSRQ